jgi:hypothetical protein
MDTKIFEVFRDPKDVSRYQSPARDLVRVYKALLFVVVQFPGILVINT